MPAAYRPSLLLFVLMSTLACAHAQTSSSTVRYGSREDLRQCLESEDRLKAERPALQRGMDANRATLKTFQDEVQAHVATQPTLDTAVDAAVAQFNARVDTLNARVAVINKEAEALQARLDDHNARMLVHNRRCAGTLYRIPDIQAVQKERAAAKGK